jgi:hypothetical protein
MVLAVAGTVHTPRGQELSADSAFATGVALLAAAWWAGFRSASQFTEAEHADVVVLPAPAMTGLKKLPQVCSLKFPTRGRLLL